MSYKIKQLRHQLETAIGNENLEEADQFKDRIKALERFYNQNRY